MAKRNNKPTSTMTLTPIDSRILTTPSAESGMTIVVRSL